jgi:hypothetical protein
MTQYRYLQAFVDKSGKPHVYFRRRGYPRIRLPDQVSSPEFALAYAAAIREEPMPPASSLLGGIIARPDRNPNAVQPLIGVYLLMRKGKVVYIGSSLNMPRRVADHRTNGRPFDKAFYIATTPREREALERVLIAAIRPLQNRVGTERNGLAVLSNLKTVMSNPLTSLEKK